jgi:hypothetical protein
LSLADFNGLFILSVIVVIVIVFIEYKADVGARQTNIHFVPLIHYPRYCDLLFVANGSNFFALLHGGNDELAKRTALALLDFLPRPEKNVLASVVAIAS